MTVVAQLLADHRSFPLGRLMGRLTGGTVELERVVPTRAAVVPFVWIRGVDPGTVRAAADPPLELVEVVEDGCLVRVSWPEGEEGGFLRALSAAPVELLSGVGTAEGWQFEVRAPDRETVAALLETLREDGDGVQLQSIHRLVPSDVGQYELTDPQREALVLAYERGYYDTPREATLAELAAELDVSRQALAARLRRGTRHLVENTLPR